MFLHKAILKLERALAVTHIRPTFDIYSVLDERATSATEAKRESNCQTMSNETTMMTMMTTTMMMTTTFQVLIFYLKGGNLKEIAHATI